LNADDVPLTHDVLAQLLGVRRAGVTECLEHFESEGLIAAKRGLITIRDPRSLEEVCCDCFRLIEGEYKHQLGSVSGNENRLSDT
jgi:Mn-dependent DtxR family transcriptional regulator